MGIKPDLVYLDASHDEANLTLDVEAWRGACHGGSLILGDDLNAWEGVRAVVKNLRAAGVKVEDDVCHWWFEV